MPLLPARMSFGLILLVAILVGDTAAVGLVGALRLLLPSLPTFPWLTAPLAILAALLPAQIAKWLWERQATSEGNGPDADASH